MNMESGNEMARSNITNLLSNKKTAESNKFWKIYSISRETQ